MIKKWWLTETGVTSTVGGITQEIRMALSFIKGVTVTGDHFPVILQSEYDALLAEALRVCAEALVELDVQANIFIGRERDDLSDMIDEALTKAALLLGGES